MNPGKLDRRIVFGNMTSTGSNDPDDALVFTTVLETWAQVRESNGRRQLESGEQVISSGTVFITRYRRDFTPDKAMRILYQGRYYTIHSFRDVDDRRRFMEYITRVTDENTES